MGAGRDGASALDTGISFLIEESRVRAKGGAGCFCWSGPWACLFGIESHKMPLRSASPGP